MGLDLYPCSDPGMLCGVLLLVFISFQCLIAVVVAGLLTCQVTLVGFPVLYILDDVSTDGRFIGNTLILWTIPMSTMGLIILPKVATVFWMKRRRAATSISGADASAGIPSPSTGDVELGSRDATTRHRTSNPETTPPPIPSQPRIQIVTFD
jgi:hypothetical protein